MGKLMDLLKGAAGEGSLHSRLGRWRLAVSKAIDALSTDFIQVQLVAGLSIADLAAATPLLFDTVMIQRGTITYSAADGFFQLGANACYELSTHVRWNTFNDPTTDRANVQWQDSDGNILSTNFAEVYAQQSTVNAASQPVARTIVCTGSSGLAVRAVSVDGLGAADFGVSSFAIVRKIG
jgi:hypothetical protein